MKKLSLPLLSEVFAEATPREGAPAPRRPSVEVARARLGGRIGDEEPSETFLAGQHVSFERAPGERGHGVVLYASAREVHVLLDATRLRRFATRELEVEPDGASGALGGLSADARVFGLLREGASVRYADDEGGLRGGKVVERCRYGALVLRGDGAIVAVGFRKLWPAPAPDAELA